MTREDFENQHVNMINYLIDLTHEATDVWKFHPENPNKIDAVEYHAILVGKIEKLEQEIADFVAEHGEI